MFKIGPKLTVMILELLDWRRSSVFNFNFEQILHIVLVFLLLTLYK